MFAQSSYDTDGIGPVGLKVVAIAKEITRKKEANTEIY